MYNSGKNKKETTVQAQKILNKSNSYSRKLLKKLLEQNIIE
jgi:hypothetical protein